MIAGGEIPGREMFKAYKRCQAMGHRSLMDMFAQALRESRAPRRGRTAVRESGEDTAMPDGAIRFATLGAFTSHVAKHFADVLKHHIAFEVADPGIAAGIQDLVYAAGPTIIGKRIHNDTKAYRLCDDFTPIAREMAEKYGRRLPSGVLAVDQDQFRGGRADDSGTIMGELQNLVHDFCTNGDAFRKYGNEGTIEDMLGMPRGSLSEGASRRRRGRAALTESNLDSLYPGEISMSQDRSPPGDPRTPFSNDFEWMALRGAYNQHNHDLCGGGDSGSPAYEFDEGLLIHATDDGMESVLADDCLWIANFDDGDNTITVYKDGIAAIEPEKNRRNMLAWIAQIERNSPLEIVEKESSEEDKEPFRYKPSPYQQPKQHAPLSAGEYSSMEDALMALVMSVYGRIHLLWEISVDDEDGEGFLPPGCMFEMSSGRLVGSFQSHTNYASEIYEPSFPEHLRIEADQDGVVRINEKQMKELEEYVDEEADRFMDQVSEHDDVAPRSGSSKPATARRQAERARVKSRMAKLHAQNREFSPDSLDPDTERMLESRRTASVDARRVARDLFLSEGREELSEKGSVPSGRIGGGSGSMFDDDAMMAAGTGWPRGSGMKWDEKAMHHRANAGNSNNALVQAIWGKAGGNNAAVMKQNELEVIRNHHHLVNEPVKFEFISGEPTTFPLHLAVQSNPDLVAPLLQAGADMNAEDSRGKTPLEMVGKWFGTYAIAVEILDAFFAHAGRRVIKNLEKVHAMAVEAGDENAAERIRGRLSKRQRQAIGESLLSVGDEAATGAFDADDALTDANPLADALHDNDIDLAVELLGKNPNLANRPHTFIDSGMACMPLHSALDLGHGGQSVQKRRLIDALLAAGADPNALDEELQLTPIEMAVRLNARYARTPGEVKEVDLRIAKVINFAKKRRIPLINMDSALAMANQYSLDPIIKRIEDYIEWANMRGWEGGGARHLREDEEGEGKYSGSVKSTRVGKTKVATASEDYDKVTFSLSGSIAALATKAIRMLKEAKDDLDDAKERHESARQSIYQIVGDVAEDPSDMFLTKILETKAAVVTVSKNTPASVEDHEKFDFEGFYEGVIELVGEELRPKIDKLREGFTEILKIDKEERQGAIRSPKLKESIIASAKARLYELAATVNEYMRSLLVWGGTYDSKLETLLARTGVHALL